MGNKEFVQILHHGQNHWITISTVGCSSNTVHVYDSLNLPFTKDLEAIVADLLFTNNTHIILKNIKIQYQRGTNDCGLFAIATACAICNGHNPAELKFNQKCMRQHLLECLSNRTLIPFPSTGRRFQQPIAREKKIQVFCTCRKSYDGTKMVECCCCKEWFHLTCLKILDANISKINWLCTGCKNN